VRIVVPWPAGGTSDILARPLAQKLTESLGQSIVIDNRGGSSGVIGMEIVAKSPADGYTVAFHSLTGHLINATFYPNLGYHTERDFVPVTLVGQVPHIIVAHPSLPVKNVKELVALAKSRPGEVNYASFGNGSTSHVAGELFKQMTKVNLVHVPYKGGAPALVDTLGGHVTLYFATFAPPLPHVKSGKLKGLGVTGAKRTAVLPDVPTVAETPGLAGYEITAMFGVLAPAGTPAAIVQRLQSEIAKAINTTDYRQRLLSEGVEEAIGSTPEQTGAYLKAELPRLTKILTEANIRSDAR
jgi:tripartite-type tricarboxylate transporter receptor subunit TctC